MNEEVRKARRTLEAVAPRIRELLLQRRRVLEETQRDPRFSEEYRRQRQGEQQEEFARSLAEIRADGERARDAMLEAAAVPTAEPGTVMEQVLAELREQRAWNRYSWALVSGREPLEVVNRAAAAGDAAGIRALRAELPAHLEAEGWVPQHIQAIEEQIRQAEEPFLSPAERAAREVQQEAQQGWGRLEAGFAHAQADLDGWTIQATELPTFEGGQIPVSEEAVA